jgi:CDP-6-deoxy-D-xylo-4-hexulose-3-dehydrase
MEEKLRNKVKEAAKEYFNYVYGEKKELSYIPVSGKLLGEEELLNMIDASLDMWLTGGRFNREFEEKLSKYLNIKYALTTNSGSSANLLAISALTSHKLCDRRLKIGDEVITVASGFPTTINPIIQCGLIPVFVDCEIGTYNIDAEKIEEAISEKTKAIFLAHTLGNPFNLNKIKTLAEKYNLWIIEDSCDALGGEYQGQKLGTIGHIGTFSFYPAHHITTGEGGAVVTNDSLIHKILLSFRDWGRDCCCPTGHDGICQKRFSQQFGNMPFGYDHKYIYSHVGFNLKLTDWQAAIGSAQIDKIDDFVKIRRENAMILNELLSDLDNYFVLPKTSVGCSWFGYLLSVKKPLNKQNLIEYLEKNNIGTRQLFAGNILRQPIFTENNLKFRIGSSKIFTEVNQDIYKLLPNTDFVMNNTFWIGVYPALGKKEMTRISDCLHQYVKENT